MGSSGRRGDHFFAGVGREVFRGRVELRDLRSPTAVPVISKRGKADLRYALYQAALVASSFNHHVMAYYRNLLSGREREPGIRTKMRVKLAAKLLIIAWALMKNKEPFNPDRLKTD
jgi:hypothetical protein